MIEELKGSLIDQLQNRGAYSVSVNGVQHYTRCPYCGDSSNLNHAHFSIRIDMSDDSIMLFRCLKCGISGMITEDVIDELGLSVATDLRKELRGYNRKGLKKMGLVNMDMESFTVPLYHDTPLNQSKLDYVNQRLGTELSYVKAHEYKMVLNLVDFMTLNELPEIEFLSYPMLKTLNNYYVGWLSCNNNTIIFRDITGKQKYRYYKIKLNQKNMNGDSFYAMPSTLPLLYTDDIHVHMAEGTFDIISIKENLVPDSPNHLFYASCGFGGSVILYYLIHHAINTGIHLHIYSDADKTDWDHQNYLHRMNHITEWIDQIVIHRNQVNDEKDYGVPKEKIHDSYRVIK